MGPFSKCYGLSEKKRSISAVRMQDDTYRQSKVVLTEMVSLWPPKLRIHSLFSASHTPIRLSRPPLARYFPSLLKASVKISSVCPFISFAACASAVILALPFLSTFEGIGRTLGNVASLLPVRRSHFVIEPSLPAVNSTLPDSEATAAVIEKRWPFRRMEGGEDLESYQDVERVA